jgi:phenylacetate-CoA ligase
MSDLLAPVIRHAIAPLWARHERSDYLRHYRQLRETQFWPVERRLDWQWQQVQALLAHAYRSTKFWRERFELLALRPDEIRNFDDYRQLPILTKDDLRSDLNDLLAEGIDRSAWHHHKTSGSTGKSVEVYVDDPAQQWRRATTLRSDEWTGWRLGEKVALVWGNPEYVKNGWRGRLRNALLERASYLDTLWMDDAAMRSFVAEQRRRHPTLMMGHAHSLYLLASFIEREGLEPFRPRGILSTAMCLHNHERAGIERVFGTQVTNRYGCEEVALIACQCEAFGGLHVNSDGVYVELLRPDGSLAGLGEPGSVVVTDLTNRAMPILRYKLGDVAVWDQTPCSCGRTLPLLARIDGREADYVFTPGGQMISGISLTENLGVLLPEAAQLQIVQERIDHLRFRIVRGEGFGEASLERLAELVAQRFGGSMTYEVEFPARIEPEASGKYRFCVSRIGNPLAARLEAATP